MKNNPLEVEGQGWTLWAGGEEDIKVNLRSQEIENVNIIFSTWSLSLEPLKDAIETLKLGSKYSNASPLVEWKFQVQKFWDSDTKSTVLIVTRD